MGLFTGMQFVFAEVSFRVRCGAPEMRSLRKIRVNLYRRTPLRPLFLLEKLILFPFILYTEAFGVGR